VHGQPRNLALLGGEDYYLDQSYAALLNLLLVLLRVLAFQNTGVLVAVIHNVSMRLVYR